MPDIIPPGNTPAPAVNDDPRTFPDFWQSDLWPALWPRTVLSYPNTVARDTDLAGLGPSSRAISYIEDLTVLEVWSGTAWKPVGGRRANGTVTIGALAVDAVQSISVTFPVGLFTTAPRVQVSTGGTKLTAAFGAVTTTGFTFSVANNASGGSLATSGYWSAEQL